MPAIRTTAAAAGIIAATPGAVAVLGIDLNNKIDLGQLIIAITSICAISALIFTMKADLRSLKEAVTERLAEMGKRVSSLENDLKEVSHAMIQVARQDERLNSADGRVRLVEERIERLQEETAWARRVPEPVRTRLAPNEPVIGRQGDPTY